MGWDAGRNLTPDAEGDIDVANSGVARDNWMLRIGTPEDTQDANLARVNGVSISGPTNDVVVNADGQLGTATASLSWEEVDITPLASLVSSVLRLRPVSSRLLKRRQRHRHDPLGAGAP